LGLWFYGGPLCLPRGEGAEVDFRSLQLACFLAIRSHWTHKIERMPPALLNICSDFFDRLFSIPIAFVDNEEILARRWLNFYLRRLEGSKTIREPLLALQ
jgi:hypothetical protein